MKKPHSGGVPKFNDWHAAVRLIMLVAAVCAGNAVHAQTQAQKDQAQSEIGAVLSGFKDTINAHTAASDLDYTHLLPYFDANFRNDGAGGIERTAEIADALRGGSVSAGAVLSIVTLSTDANGNSKASTTGTMSATSLQGPLTKPWSPTDPDSTDFVWYYKPAGGAWKLYGNQEPGRFRVKTFVENRQAGPDCPSCSGAFNFVWFDANVPLGQIASITVTGSGFNATPLVIGSTRSQSSQGSPSPAPVMTFSAQTFQFYGPAVSSLPPPGSVYTFTVTPTSGQPFQVTRTVPQTTSQTIAVTNPTGHSLADAHLGGALTINWTLPSFPVLSVNTFMNTNSAAGNCDVPQPDDSLAANTTAFTFNSVPTQCLGQPIADNVSQGSPMSVVVEVIGINGEDTRAWYPFGTSACSGTNVPPGSLSTASVAANLIQLQWIRACMPTTISNYEIWRSTSLGGPFTKIGFTDQNTRSFNDGTVSGGVTYHYYVIANDIGGNHSGESNHFTVTASGATVTTTGSTMTLGGGWNLVGNGLNAPLNVATVFGDATKVNTVWKWIAIGAKWAFYAPSLAGQALNDYAAGKGYDVLTTVNGGEGVWVNAKAPFAAQLPTGTAVTSSAFQSMASGWNLIAIGDGRTPSQFNTTLSTTPPTVGVIPVNVTTLWAWDAARANWYFYAPSLDMSGGLPAYIVSKNYLDFGTRVLDPTTGFWVNKP